LILACIHGVSHGPEARRTYAARWESILRASGLDATCVACPWSSSGVATEDWWNSIGSKAEHAQHLREVQDGFEGGPGVREAKRLASLKGEPFAILTHSWGCVIGHSLKTLCGWLDDAPLIALASPHTHQWLGRRIVWAGRAKPWVGDGVTFIQNRDDKICSASRWLPTYPAPAREAWIDIDDDKRRGLAQEHDEELYLEHPRVIDEIREATA
jgi:hypothetical protein